MALPYIPQFKTFTGTEGGIVFDLSQLYGLIEFLNSFGDRAVAELMFEAKNLFDEALSMSQEIVHVITGELKGSGVVQTVSGTEIQYRYDKEYAGYEEFGNAYREGHPYFRPSLEFIQSNLPQRFDAAMQRFVSRTGGR